MEPEKDIFEQWREDFEAKPWYIKLWDRIRTYFKSKFRYYPYYLKYGLENILYWFKVIWKDRSWDHDFIFIVLRHKLAKQASDLRKYSHHVDAEYYAERMELCVRLIDKITSNFYELEPLDYYKTKSWFEPIKGREGFSEWNSKIVEERYEEYFNKYPLIYKKVINGEYKYCKGREMKKESIANIMGNINQQRAINLLFKIIGNDIQRWWY